MRQNEVFHISSIGWAKTSLRVDGPNGKWHGKLGGLGKAGPRAFCPSPWKSQVDNCWAEQWTRPSLPVVSWAIRGLRPSPRNFSFQENNGNLVSLMKLEMQKRSFTLS